MSIPAKFDHSRTQRSNWCSWKHRALSEKLCFLWNVFFRRRVVGGSVKCLGCFFEQNTLSFAKKCLSLSQRKQFPLLLRGTTKRCFFLPWNVLPALGFLNTNRQFLRFQKRALRCCSRFPTVQTRHSTRLKHGTSLLPPHNKFNSERCSSSSSIGQVTVFVRFRVFFRSLCPSRVHF